MTFEQLKDMASQAIGLFDTAKATFETLKGNVAAAKDTLAADEQAELNAMLEEIHARNASLSAQLDDTMAKLQARG